MVAGRAQVRGLHSLPTFVALNPINCCLTSMARNGIISVYLAPNMKEWRQRKLVLVYESLFCVARILQTSEKLWVDYVMKNSKRTIHIIFHLLLSD